ncbi:MAG: REP-associated tyrosine transposase [Blastocatellia bacterium]|nr:REP-associated tyrosine transposase [Blastocatellia bacterium]
MGNLDYKQFAERHRPHINPPGGNLFVTYRLAGSIPKVKVREYRAKKEWWENERKRVRKKIQSIDAFELETVLSQIERFNREWFVKFENILHRAKVGPMWMQDERVADKVAENLKRLDGSAYRLDAYSVMSNHVHAVFQTLLSERDLTEIHDPDGGLVFASEYPGLSRIMHSLKGRSARECNVILMRTGAFWEHESFDHVIRPGKFSTTIRYVLNNPVKAGLVKNWRDWRWNYCRPELSQTV